MTDIALNTSAGESGFGFDWSMVFGDLATDEGMATAVAISLFSEATAGPDDVLPDNSGDRRGWWGDAYLDTIDGKPDTLGSLLWLLERAKATAQTAQRAQAYAAAALQWLITDGEAAEVQVQAQYTNREDLLISGQIVRGRAAGNYRFAYLWNPTKPAPVVQLAAPFLATEDGQILADEFGNKIALF